jgi:pimeloyl-ACP methyl ester carboxylesterase
MIFVHPNPTDRACWLYQSARFSTWCRTVTIDLPGYGRSPSAGPDVSTREIARACWAAADTAAPGPAVLVGLSVGSTVAQHMAAARPERTLALVLTGGGYAPRRDFSHRIRALEERGLSDRRRYVLELFGPDFRETPLAAFFADLFASRSDGTDPTTIARVFRLLEVAVPDAVLGAIRAPTLIVTGSADAAHDLQYELQRRIAGCELRVIVGAGHLVALERPTEYDRAVLEFLRRHEVLPD